MKRKEIELKYNIIYVNLIKKFFSEYYLFIEKKRGKKKRKEEERNIDKFLLRIGYKSKK